MFHPNSFTEILTSLEAAKLPQVGCEEHRIVFMTNIRKNGLVTNMAESTRVRSQAGGFSRSLPDRVLEKPTQKKKCSKSYLKMKKL
ncbi:hypothetical protein OUZ56_029963 [Daphnia magna]|uniref:Uncharacterized protein n=1 Tax=Daphnia magna TaxID=35525 RepID=A0ABR0B8F1_9CRUS|nr:hypothetical protein OUZ56_029963 [Daphnia magna]